MSVLSKMRGPYKEKLCILKYFSILFFHFLVACVNPDQITTCVFFKTTSLILVNLSKAVAGSKKSCFRR